MMRRFDPDDRAEPGAGGRVLRRFTGYVRPYRRQYLIAALSILALTCAELLPPWLFSQTATLVTRDDASIRDVNILGAAALATLLLRTFAGWSQLYHTTWLGHTIVADIRVALFNKLQSLSIGYIERRGVGSLMSRIQNDVTVLNDFFSDSAATILSRSLILIGIVVVMFLANWQMALLACAVVPPMIVALRYFRKHALIAYRRTRTATSLMNADLAESIAGVRVTAAFGQESRRFDQFTSLNRNTRVASMTAARQMALALPVAQLASATATALMLAGMGNAVFGIDPSVGDIVLFIGLIERFFEPIRDLSQQFTAIQSTVAASERVFAMIDLEPELEDAPDAIDLPPVNGRVSVDDVTFGYLETPVLRNVSFAAEPGQVIALVGETGAGKSSIINLLVRFHDVWSGSVTYDGFDVRDVTQQSLRSQIALVLQDSFLFSMTVRENIRFGRPEATDEEVEKAAREVGADRFIRRLPNGYDTPVTERGSTLSAGQRQLLSLARAMLADRQVLILDEATSSVDSETEMQIQRGIARVLSGRTSFVIAHRLSTIRSADQVLVLKDGEIVERGTHDDLIARNGYFARLHRAQWQTAAASGE